MSAEGALLGGSLTGRWRRVKDGVAPLATVQPRVLGKVQCACNAEQYSLLMLLAMHSDCLQYALLHTVLAVIP